ncbi:MAG: SDR family NAD(P)-dependent oxidoreductase [Opitutales bacterium]
MIQKSDATTVIVGVGSGLGAALVRKFSAEGCPVAALARSEDSLQSVADSCADPDRILPVGCDATSVQSVSEAFQRVRDTLGPIHTLIYNAGAGGWSSLADGTVDDFEQALTAEPGR